MLQRYETFSGAVASIYHHIQRVEREEMEHYGSKGVYAQYLAILRRDSEGLTMQQLCAVCDKDKAAVSRTIADMERSGLVERIGESVYRARLTLTEAGRRAADYVSERACTIVDQVGGGLTEEDRQVLYAALATIAQRLEQVTR